jgi:hypothetical protein
MWLLFPFRVQGGDLFGTAELGLVDDAGATVDAGASWQIDSKNDGAVWQPIE